LFCFWRLFVFEPLSKFFIQLLPLYYVGKMSVSTTLFYSIKMLVDNSNSKPKNYCPYNWLGKQAMLFMHLHLMHTALEINIKYKHQDFKHRAIIGRSNTIEF